MCRILHLDWEQTFQQLQHCYNFFFVLPSLELLTLLVAVPFVHRVLQESYHFISRVLIEERGPFNTSSPDSTVLLESRIFVVYLIRF